ncbi:matrixin family metalloprotease [Archangium minus]|uniref:Matrixin family metalloprotease n=1 Tax=Archangium minus TaxID=83450 RepID=A0ABY9WJY4_9BACT|nr:matrixin family metalloprotease [Archangium minus]
MLKFRSVAFLASVTLLGTACGPEAAPEEQKKMSWEEFQANVYQEPETGVFIYAGDQMAEDEAELRAAYEQMAGGDVGQTTGELCVYSSGGNDIKWTASQALNLTYCVSTKFGGNYSKVVSAMNTAASAWEGAAKVNFIHVSAQDSNCTSRNSNVVFDVSPVNVGGQYLARAFFPNSSRRSRNVLIDNSAFQAGAPGLDGILRHELGHTLGFRHEHTRPEAGACYEDNQWRALTSYDSSSVMHYPQCNGTNTWNLTLTTLDKQGAASLYP